MPIILILMSSLLCINCSESDKNIDTDVTEKLFINGDIYTGYDVQESILIKDGIIQYVGNESEARNRASENVTTIDLAGQFMMAGIHDIHQHPLEASSDNFQFILTLVDDPEDYVVEVQKAVDDNPDADWILGWGYDLEVMLEANRNPKDILDDIDTDQPIAIMELTSHSIWCNSKALELAGYDIDSENPVGGILMRADNDELNGLLMDNAGNLIIDLALKLTEQSKENDYLGLIENALPELAKNGITSICDARTYWKRDHHKTWQRIENEGLLTVRVNLGLWAYPNEDDRSQLQSLKALYSNNSKSLLKINQIKLYSDGIIHNTTAAMQKDYKLDYFGEMTNNGLNYFTEDRIAYYISELEPIGFDFHIHAIGDRGIHEGINAIAQYGTSNGRHRLTHVEYVSPSDYDRFAQHNITVDVQVAGDFTKPDHWHDFDFLIDPTLSENYIPIKTLGLRGARICLSSDWDVSTLNPFIGMQNAVARSPQNLTIEQAIAAYTINPAYLMRQENKVGTLEVGKEADMIVLNKNLLEIPSNEISTVIVKKAYLKGEVIFE